MQALLEDAQRVSSGIHDNSWVDGTLGAVGGSLDALGMAIDPLGTLAAWGVGWLIEHVRPLQEALDQLAGKPDEIAERAGAWQGVAESIGIAREQYMSAIEAETAGWFGAAGDAYRGHAGEQLAALDGLATVTKAISYAVEGAGLLVGLVRDIVRDLIAQFVATLAVRLPQWLAAEGLTLGIATPVVAAQVVGLVSRWANRIQDFVRALLNSLRRLTGKLDELTGLFRHPGKRTGHRQTGGEVRRPRNSMDYEVRWADEAYDEIRRGDDELPAIAATAREHGFTPEDIRRVKNHLFREEHLLDSYSDGEMGRFDANPRIAEAWHRLAEGQPHPADLDLLRHERHEAEFMARTGDLSYRRAHAATLDAGFTWDPEAAAADGLGYQHQD
ncbi:hypothetical protein FB565_000614 [Actinoplanes lutulentus]|uniref:WXG100 family type VII secretion target n=1 Tax=Actinoplanes lutulentus TaxID=1287878 RepID=A0A327ZKS2_9ACTN|nr:hypothetical protein [Actinoplanes lutulentus]MBB2940910.1 hypothetical protein [Actinoplanes lutulentus]RAK43219.1 hypothetical protein B0I29_101349 [Actinoplanes lutulentus]